jgi:hypothetical protein
MKMTNVCAKSRNAFTSTCIFPERKGNLTKELLNFCFLSVHVDNYTIIVPTKCTSLLKAQDITICTFCLCILSPYMFQPTWAIFMRRKASA